MSADDEAPDDLKERCRRAIAFLQRAREVQELTPAQIDRMERRLHQPRSAARRPLLSPALAALFVLLLAGGALAMAGRDLTRLPGVGRWIGVMIGRGHASHAPETRAGTRPAQLQSSAMAASVSARLPLPEQNREELPAPKVEASGASNASAPHAGNASSAEPAHETRVALVGRHHVSGQGVAAPPPTASDETPERDREPALAHTAEPALAPAPPATSSSTAPIAAPAPALAEHAAPRSSPDPVAATPENPIVAESRSFASALALWHRNHDAAAALVALDAHERRFPTGQIQLEARLLRAEILLAGNRDREALALLDQLALGGLPRTRELRTVRGELRIRAGRCADGNADLQAVLANGDSDGFAQRARRAIAACH